MYVQLEPNPLTYLFYISIFTRHHPTPCKIRPEKPSLFSQKPNRYRRIPGENPLVFAGVCHWFDRDQIPSPYLIRPAGQPMICRKNIFPQGVAICPRNVPIYSEGQFGQLGQQLARICRRGSAYDTGAARPSWISPCGARCPVRLRGYLMISKYIYTYTYLFIINTSYLKMRFFNG